MKKRMLSAITGALVLTLALGACSGEEEPIAVEPEPTPTPEVLCEWDETLLADDPECVEPEPEIDLDCDFVFWPLTGVETDEVAQIPALGIKIENSPAARPQMGLEYADIVFEQLVEGGITRFVAVYNSIIPEEVLPVRSARPMDPAIMAPFHGLFAYSGAQRRFIDMVNETGVQSIIMDSGHAGFRRTTDRRAPHNVIGDPETFLSLARPDREIPAPQQFFFACAPGQGTATLEGTPVSRLDVTMSTAQNSVWEWNEEEGVFQLYNGTRPSVSTTGVQHSAVNVVLLNTWQSGRYGVPETMLINEQGRATVAANGRVFEGIWRKGAVDEPFVLETEDGETIRLEPGNTWINLVPDSNHGGSFEIIP